MDPLNAPLQIKTSFYYPLRLLARPRREAMEVFYRFCWAADDISDGPATPSEKKKRLSYFHKALDDCFKGRSEDPFFQKLQKAIGDFRLSREPFERILKGVERDLYPVRFTTFEELHRYSLQVAGGPGLVSMEIFGFRDEAHHLYAENLAVFLQIVNVVRDFREDALLGRQYLPLQDFKRFQLDAAHPENNLERWKPFVEFQLDRAGAYLENARSVLTHRQRGELMTAEAIASVYGKLFDRLRHHPEKILEGTLKLSKADKLGSALGAALRCGIWKLLSA